MSTMKNAVVMGLAATAMFVGSSVAHANIFQPEPGQQIQVRGKGEKFCSMIVQDDTAGIATPFMIQAGIPYDTAKIVMQSSFPANVNFDVKEDWTSTAPWGGEMPDMHNIAISRDGAHASDFTNISENGSNTGTVIRVEPNKDINHNAFNVYAFTSDMWSHGDAEATVTLTATCSE